MVPNNAKTINSSRLTKMVSSCLTYSDEEADAFYDEISQISAPTIRHAISALCEKILDNSRTVSFKELAAGLHIRWYNVEDNKTIDAVIVRVLSIRRKNGTSVCIAKTEEGTQFLIDSTNVKDIELIP